MGERADQIETTKVIFAAAAAAGEHGNDPAQANRVPPKATPIDHLGKSAAHDDQRRRELKSIMKDRSLDMEEKNRLIEKIE